MAVEDKKISYRIYLVAFTILVMAILIAIKLTNIQWVEGEYYRELAKERTVRNIEIPANRGNVYSSDGLPNITDNESANGFTYSLKSSIFGARASKRMS